MLNELNEMTLFCQFLKVMVLLEAEVEMSGFNNALD